MAGKAKVVLTDYVWESLEVEKKTLAGLAELVVRHPDRFPAFAAALSLHDVDAALAEIGRADAMGAIGFQICTHMRGTRGAVSEIGLSRSLRQAA